MRDELLVEPDLIGSYPDGTVQPALECLEYTRMRLAEPMPRPSEPAAAGLPGRPAPMSATDFTGACRSTMDACRTAYHRVLERQTEIVRDLWLFRETLSRLRDGGDGTTVGAPARRSGRERG